MKFGYSLVGAILSIGAGAASAGAVEQAPAPQPRPAAAAAETPILQRVTPRLSVMTGIRELACNIDREGGMLTSIINAALAEERPTTSYAIDFVVGDNPHARQLSDPALNPLSFPWYRPDCVKPLDDRDAALCDDFAWSESLYDMLVGYHSLASANLRLAGLDDLDGASVCVPSDELARHLRREGVDRIAALEVRATPEACVAALRSGDVEFVFLPLATAEAMNRTGDLAAHEALDTALTVHAIAPKSDPQSVAALEMLGAGLGTIRDNGKWFEIIARFHRAHLGEPVVAAATQ